MCAIILAAKELEASWVLALDADAEWVGDENDIRANTGGIGKRFPMGPVCKLDNGIEIPTFCCVSDNACITPDLLVKMLNTIDSFDVFDRSSPESVAPFLLLDGHGSRFDVQFL